MTRRRLLAAAAATPFAAAGIYLIVRFWVTLFGPGTWGSGGNMVAWVICGVISFWWLHTKEQARHLAQLTLARQHHQEVMDQAQRHHEDLKAHVTAATGNPPPGGVTVP